MLESLRRMVGNHSKDARDSHKCGKRLCFHGRFADKQVAMAKEKQVQGSFIIEREIQGDTYYLVVTEKK